MSLPVPAQRLPQVYRRGQPCSVESRFNLAVWPGMAWRGAAAFVGSLVAHSAGLFAATWVVSMVDVAAVAAAVTMFWGALDSQRASSRARKLVERAPELLASGSHEALRQLLDRAELGFGLTWGDRLALGWVRAQLLAASGDAPGAAALCAALLGSKGLTEAEQARTEGLRQRALEGSPGE